jgi:octaprenyl-diphosphate synthase
MQLAQSLLQEELIVFEKKFREAVKSQAPLLDRSNK